MKALILAGGEGTRLRPLTLHTPKPVVPVVTVPFLKYQVELLRQHGIHEVILSLSYQPDKIEDVLGDGSILGVKLQYVVEKSPLGTAGAFKNAEAFLDDATLVFNGDILCELDLSDVISQHRRRQATATLVLTRVENPSAYGLVETQENGRITRFLEKPGKDEITCNTINAGTYILEPEVLSLIPPGEKYSFERGLFPALLERQRPMWAYISERYWIDIGTPQKYLQVHQDILHERFHPAIPPAGRSIGSHLPDSRSGIGAGGVDRHSYVDPTAQIGEAARIVSSTVGRDCIIGRDVLIENSVIWPGVTVGDSARLMGCIVGNDCEIGHHAVISQGVVLGSRSKITEYSLLSGEGTPRI
jgi:NDP-sugar pyrophosphorylase family protein